MKTKKTFVILVSVILFLVVSMNIFKKDLWDVNAELLKQEVLSVGKSVETVNFLDITPFQWDVVYSFDPYTSKDKIYETVGY